MLHLSPPVWLLYKDGQRCEAFEWWTNSERQNHNTVLINLNSWHLPLTSLKTLLHEPFRSYGLRRTVRIWISRSSGVVWKSRWPSWAPVPNKPTVSVDVKQHSTNLFTNGRVSAEPRGSNGSAPRFQSVRPNTACNIPNGWTASSSQRAPAVWTEAKERSEVTKGW